MQIFDTTIKELVDAKLSELENKFEADVVFYTGEIVGGLEKFFRDCLETLSRDGIPNPKNRLVVFLNTPGGSAETVEKLVEIIRYHYDEVYFVVPDYAMSAGTIFCMAGNEIYMDYSSSLGPIDPQVEIENRFVPALGYLDQVDKLLEKNRRGELTTAEFALLRDQDLALLNLYEQQKNLTVTLLKDWIVKYKFSTWTIHQSNRDGKQGLPVTQEEKEQRAEEIAQKLGDNKKWHSHGRFISMRTLTAEVGLKITDYSEDKELQSLIRSYNDLLLEYLHRNNIMVFLHSRHQF